VKRRKSPRGARRAVAALPLRGLEELLKECGPCGG
jgi:hypothetical protein